MTGCANVVLHQIQVGMSVIYVLLAISICVALVFFLAFIRSVKAGQYDDSYTPSVRMLFEDELVQNEDDVQLKKSKKTNQIKDTNQ